MQVEEVVCILLNGNSSLVLQEHLLWRGVQAVNQASELSWEGHGPGQGRLCMHTVWIGSAEGESISQVRMKSTVTREWPDTPRTISVL